MTPPCPDVAGSSPASPASLIEQVGRALAKEEGYAYDPIPYDDRARAAIAAMREPTEGMCDAAIPKLLYDDQRDCIADAYQAMIDEALK